MKHLLCICLALILLLTCAPAIRAEETVFQFTRDNFPKLDGSTSMVPLGNGIASVLLGESREDTASLISFNRTTQSFRNLCSGESDIVIAAEPKSEVFDEMAQQAFPYEMEQIATEALVFVVNENNPISSLTTQQVQGIYSGEITNWSQVGGEDAPIAAFQRNPSAGSQVMMEKLVMDGIPMMEAPSTMVPEEMGALIESVHSYDNSANAIGYTVFYYAADMQMAQGLKILQIDGVAPCAETLRSGEYSFLNGYYCCISALAPADSPQRILFDWLVSEAGQALLTLEGYVSVYAPGEAPTSGDNVRTDYTAYTPNGGTPAKYTLFDCAHDYLEPREDYGSIYPYVGVQLYSSWGDNSADYQTGSLKGFFNHQGQLITNPVYTDIYPVSLGDEVYVWLVSDGTGYGYATKDGSYFSGLCYEYLYAVGDYLLCLTDYEGPTFDLFDKDLNLVATHADYTFGGKIYFPDLFSHGMTCCHHIDENWNEEYILIDEAGNILMESGNYMRLDDNGIIFVHDEDWNTTAYLPDLTLIEPLQPDAYMEIIPLCSNFYRVINGEDDYIIDKNGTIFEWDFDEAAYATGDGFMVTKDGASRLYDSRGRLRWSDLDANWSYLGDDVFFEFTDGGELLLHKLEGDKTLSFPDGNYAYVCGEVYVVGINLNSGWTCRAVDKDLNLLPQIAGDLTTTEDMITAETYLLAYDSFGFTGEQRLLTLDAQTQLFRANGQLQLQDGYITVSNDWAFTCYDPEGNLIFCYPYFGMASGD